MRLGFKWIPKEQKHIDFTFGNATTNLLVTTKWTTAQPLDGKAGFLGNKATRCASSNEDMLGQKFSMFAYPLEEFIFHVVVSNKRDGLFGGDCHFDFADNHVSCLVHQHVNSVEVK